MAMNNWMEDLEDDRVMNTIILPASHDSGMAYKETSTSTLSPTTKSNACTHRLNIAEQLAAGIRWLDVRLKAKDTGDRCFHGGALGESSLQVANAIIDFLNDNPKEVVIVLLTKSGDGTYDTFLDNLIARHKAKKKEDDPAYDRMQPMHGRDAWQIAKLTLGDLRGRVVVAMDKPPEGQEKQKNRRIVRAKLKKHDAKTKVVADNVEPFSGTAAKGKYSYMLNSGGSYSNSNDSKTIKSRQKERFDNLKPRVAAVMPVYYTTNTSSIGLRATSIETQDKQMWKDQTKPKWAAIAFAKDINSKLVYNAVMMDFATEERCQFIRTEAAKVE